MDKMTEGIYKNHKRIKILIDDELRLSFSAEVDDTSESLAKILREMVNLLEANSEELPNFFQDDAL